MRAGTDEPPEDAPRREKDAFRRREAQRRKDRRTSAAIDETLGEIDSLLDLMGGGAPQAPASVPELSAGPDGWAAGSITTASSSSPLRSRSAGLRKPARAPAAKRAVASAGQRAARGPAIRRREPAWDGAAVEGARAPPMVRFQSAVAANAADGKRAASASTAVRRPRAQVGKRAASAGGVGLAGPSASSRALRASEAATRALFHSAAPPVPQQRDRSMSKLGERVRYAGLTYPEARLQPGVGAWPALQALPGGVALAPVLYTQPGGGLTLLYGEERLTRVHIAGEAELAQALPALMEELCASQARPRDPVAVVKSASLAGDHASAVQLLYSPAELRAAVQELLRDSEDDDLPPTCIQRFVSGRSAASASVARAVFEAGKQPFVWLLSDASNAIADTASDGCYIARVLGATYAQPKQMAVALAKALERAHRVRITLLVADFVQDGEERWWLTQIKAFQYAAAAVSTDAAAPAPRRTTVPVAPQLSQSRRAKARAAATEAVSGGPIRRDASELLDKPKPKPKPKKRRGPKLAKCPGDGCRAYFDPAADGAARVPAADVRRCRVARDLEREFHKLPTAQELDRALRAVEVAEGALADGAEEAMCAACAETLRARIGDLRVAHAKEARAEKRRAKHRAEVKAQLAEEREARAAAAEQEAQREREMEKRSQRRRRRPRTKRRPKVVEEEEEEEDPPAVEALPATPTRREGAPEPPMSPWRAAAAAAARILKSPGPPLWKTASPPAAPPADASLSPVAVAASAALGLSSPASPAAGGPKCLSPLARVMRRSSERTRSPLARAAPRPPADLPVPAPGLQRPPADVAPLCDVCFMAEHAPTCPRALVACALGCGARLERGQQQAHAGLCELRAAACEQCGREVPLQTLARHKAMACSARKVPCARGCGASLPMLERAAHEEACAGPKRMHTITAPAAGAVLDDVAFKERILSAIREALGRGIHLRLVALLRDNDFEPDRCKLLLRTLYRDTRPFCRDQGECPPVDAAGEEMSIELQPWLLAGGV